MPRRPRRCGSDAPAAAALWIKCPGGRGAGAAAARARVRASTYRRAGGGISLDYAPVRAADRRAAAEHLTCALVNVSPAERADEVLLLLCSIQPEFAWDVVNGSGDWVQAQVPVVGPIQIQPVRRCRGRFSTTAWPHSVVACASLRVGPRACAWVAYLPNRSALRSAEADGLTSRARCTIVFFFGAKVAGSTWLSKSFGLEHVSNEWDWEMHASTKRP